MFIQNWLRLFAFIVRTHHSSLLTLSRSTQSSGDALIINTRSRETFSIHWLFCWTFPSFNVLQLLALFSLISVYFFFLLLTQEYFSIPVDYVSRGHDSSNWMKIALRSILDFVFIWAFIRWWWHAFHTLQLCISKHRHREGFAIKILSFLRVSQTAYFTHFVARPKKKSTNEPQGQTKNIQLSSVDDARLTCSKND